MPSVLALVLSVTVHVLFSSWLLVAIAILAWVKFRSCYQGCARVSDLVRHIIAG